MTEVADICWVNHNGVTWVYAKSSALPVEIEQGGTRPVVALEPWSFAPVCSSLGCHLRWVAQESNRSRRRVKRDNTYVQYNEKYCCLYVLPCGEKSQHTATDCFCKKAQENRSEKNIHGVGIHSAANGVMPSHQQPTMMLLFATIL